MQAEIEVKSGHWALYKGGFGTIPDAEEWIRDNIGGGIRMRAVRVAGVFRKETRITKR